MYHLHRCLGLWLGGSLLSIYTWLLDVGAFTAVGIVYNTWNRPDSGAYKIVMGCQMIYPILIICLEDTRGFCG